MDVDDLGFVAEDDLRAENAHVPCQDDEVGVVLCQHIEQFVLVGRAVRVTDVVEWHVVSSREWFEVVVVTDDDLDLGVEGTVFAGLEDGLQAVTFLRDQDGDGLGLVIRREPHRYVRVQFFPQFLEVGQEGRFRTDHLGRVDVHRHTEVALPDGLVEVLDVDAPLEEQRGHLGDQPRNVVADDRDLCTFATNRRHRD
jgi:hypothetical protein